MLERNRLLQQPNGLDCLSPEPMKTTTNNQIIKSLSGTNLVVSLSSAVVDSVIKENVIKNGNGHLERQSTSEEVSTPSSNSREADNEKY